MSRLAIKTSLAILFLLAHQAFGCSMEGGVCNIWDNYDKLVECCWGDKVFECDDDPAGHCKRINTSSPTAVLPDDDSMAVSTEEAKKLLGMAVWAGALVLLLAILGGCGLIALSVAAVWYCTKSSDGGGQAVGVASVSAQKPPAAQAQAPLQA